jgi:hypothetical protein
VRLFYFYSRLRHNIDRAFVEKIIERVYLFMDQLSERDYAMVVRAVASLNYHNEVLLSKLKQFNYELFLVNLKYDCRTLGPYYRAVLEEVE